MVTIRAGVACDRRPLSAAGSSYATSRSSKPISASTYVVASSSCLLAPSTGIRISVATLNTAESTAGPAGFKRLNSRSPPGWVKRPSRHRVNVLVGNGNLGLTLLGGSRCRSQVRRFSLFQAKGKGRHRCSPHLLPNAVLTLGLAGGSWGSWGAGPRGIGAAIVAARQRYLPRAEGTIAALPETAG